MISLSPPRAPTPLLSLADYRRRLPFTSASRQCLRGYGKRTESAVTTFGSLRISSRTAEGSGESRLQSGAARFEPVLLLGAAPGPPAADSPTCRRATLIS